MSARKFMKEVTIEGEEAFLWRCQQLDADVLYSQPTGLIADNIILGVAGFLIFFNYHLSCFNMEPQQARI